MGGGRHWGMVVFGGYERFAKRFSFVFTFEKKKERKKMVSELA